MWNGVVDVQDVAEAHIRAAFNPQAHGRYIICSETLSLLEMGKILREAFGPKFRFRATSCQKRLSRFLVLWPALAVNLLNSIWVIQFSLMHKK